MDTLLFQKLNSFLNTSEKILLLFVFLGQVTSLPQHTSINIRWGEDEGLVSQYFNLKLFENLRNCVSYFPVFVRLIETLLALQSQKLRESIQRKCEHIFHLYLKDVERKGLRIHSVIKTLLFCSCTGGEPLIFDLESVCECECKCVARNFCKCAKQ